MIPTIVVYMGGTCGDITTAVIDPAEAQLRNGAVLLNAERSRLKKPHTFESNLSKDQYVNEIGLVYNSISSHDLNYHIKKQHNFIGIVVNDAKVALWAAERFKNLHRPHVWQEMQNYCGANSVQDYAQNMIDFGNLVRQHTDQIIQVERIMQGKLVEDLATLNVGTAGKEFYQAWLKNQQL
jgi:hypothetical protein